MLQVSHTLADQQVAAVYLVHGVSSDPGADYTESYAHWFESGILASDRPTIPVRLFQWSGEANHLGCADGAVRLIDELSALGLEPGQRVLLWGHQYAGNLFALTTFLLSGRANAVARFFRAARIYYRWPVLSLLDIPVWNRVRRRLRNGQPPLPGIRLDFVTFGTPARYAWDPAGYSQLLHFVEHSATASPAADTSHGLFAWRARVAERRLGRVLALLARKRRPAEPALIGATPADAAMPDGMATLVVDYDEGGPAQYSSTHPAFVRKEWLLFHAEEVVRRLYAARVVKVA
jgi:hypothetical protein